MKKIIAILLCFVTALAFSQSNTYNILDRYTAAISSGTIDGTVIGGTTPAAGSFTTITSSTSGSTSSITITDTGGNGANLKLVGPGSNPNKYLRVNNGTFDIINSAYGAAILSLTDGGNLTLGGTAKSTTYTSGSASLTLTTGAIGLSKMTASASAPGAAGAKLEVVCGTNAGTAKLIIYAGTSATAITIVDNIGTGVTGC